MWYVRLLKAKGATNLSNSRIGLSGDQKKKNGANRKYWYLPPILCKIIPIPMVQSLNERIRHISLIAYKFQITLDY